MQTNGSENMENGLDKAGWTVRILIIIYIKIKKTTQNTIFNLSGYK